jgi:Zinc carboxypeptidase
MTYPIGTPGVAWGDKEKKEWLQQTQIKRSYQKDVIDRIHNLPPHFDIHKYGALSLDPVRYPLFAITSPASLGKKPCVLVTGGVHGYETSGVLGGIAFLEKSAEKFVDDFNFIVAPCVSPWGYETINRWNNKTIDPNRSFKGEGLCEEASALIKFLNDLTCNFVLHVDLHETTDTDESEFRPALAARDGKAFVPCEIPDGFYLVGDSSAPVPQLQRAIIDSVATVTHIAASDAQGRLLGDKAQQEGVINYDVGALGLCASVTAAPYRTTTEVYPDSATSMQEECLRAQVVALEAALGYVKSAL